MNIIRKMQWVMWLATMGPLAAVAQRGDSAAVSRLNREWIASYATRDTATMKRILANDFFLIGPSGKRFSKRETIANLGSTKQHTTATIDSASVRMFGNTAMILAYTHFAIESGGNVVQGRNCYLDLYVKRHGRWQAVAGHVTLLK